MYITVAAERLAWNDWLPKLFKNTISSSSTSLFNQLRMLQFLLCFILDAT